MRLPKPYALISLASSIIAGVGLHASASHTLLVAAGRCSPCQLPWGICSLSQANAADTNAANKCPADSVVLSAKCNGWSVPKHED